ncbi:hypothetical protein FQA47_020906 [Oryzias melastigma]|uniref:Uncharacterized protein n=1 Tax=Oryzias melastigma TaxID=30732 RepID=A0A834CIS1_ORYME|nr:hypothetical protein FQA47_020906 [Oryzias melastigma]
MQVSSPSQQPLTFLKTHNTQRSPLLTDVPGGKKALKNSHRWCYTPPASVTSQTVPHAACPPRTPVPLICFLEAGGSPKTHLSPSFHADVYRSAPSVSGQHQHHTAHFNL